MVRGFEGRKYDPHYLAFFDCFNSGQFYEAHEVLEQIWLPHRKDPNGNFYKGLIQLAGAFVHLQRGRCRPAAALLKLAKGNLESYGVIHAGLDLGKLKRLVEEWLMRLEVASYDMNSLGREGIQWPTLQVGDLKIG